MFCPLLSTKCDKVICEKGECALFHEGDCALYVIAEALSTLASNVAELRGTVGCRLGEIAPQLKTIADAIGAK